MKGCTLLLTPAFHAALRSPELSNEEKQLLLWLHGFNDCISCKTKLMYSFFMALNDDELDLVSSIYPEEAEAVEHWQSGILREECERAWRAENQLKGVSA